MLIERRGFRIAGLRGIGLGCLCRFGLGPGCILGTHEIDQFTHAAFRLRHAHAALTEQRR